MDSIAQITSNDEFSKLCKNLFTAEYEDFQTIDDSGGDAGNDGYSQSNEMLFQLYTPEKPEKITDARYKTKITDDLNKAKKLVDSGKYCIKKWVFVTPRELSESVQTYIRNEAKIRGFEGVAWSSPKLTGLLAQHKHLRSQFPNLIQPDIEDLIRTEVVANLESKEEIEKRYRSKNELKYKKRIDDARDILNAGKYETAKKDYLAIIKELEEETEPINRFLFFRAYNNLGNCEMNLGHYDKAAELFEKGYENAPADPKAIANYALAKSFKDRDEEALEIIEKLLATLPNDESAISIKSSILEKLHKYDDLSKFLKEKGRVELVHLYDGLAAMHRKDFDAATAAFEKATQFEPKNVKAYMYAAQNVLVGSRESVKDNPFPTNKIPEDRKLKFEKAILWLTEAIKLLENIEHKEDLEMAYTNLSGCYLAIGLFEKSIAIAEKAIQIDPLSPMAYLNHGISKLKLNKYADSIVSLNKFKDLGGNEPDIERHIALASLRTGNLDAAQTIIDSELQKEAGLNLDFAELGMELYSRRLNFEQLETLLKRLETEFPNDPQALGIRAGYLHSVGREGALPLLQKALELSRSESEKIITEIHIADTFYYSKEYKKAADIYEKYMDTKESNRETLRYAESLYNSGQYGKLLKWIETIDLSLRKDTFIRQLEAYSNLYLNNLDKASILFKELFENNPNNFQYLTFYGLCKIRLGKETEAKQAYDAIKNRVTETADLITLASCYESVGERKLALELTYKALENDPNNPKTHLAYIFTFLRREQVDEKDFEEKYIKLFQKSIEEFSKKFPEEKALQGFEIKDNDISEILKMADKVSESTGIAMGFYKDSKAPLGFVPKFTGKNPFDIWAAFTNMPDVGIKISFGSPDEITIENSTIEEFANRSVVIDIYPLFLLAHLKRLDLLAKTFKKVYVHQSILDALTEIIDDRRVSAKKGITSFGKIEGQHRITEIPPEEVQKVLAMLEEIKDFLITNEIVEIRGLAEEKPIQEREVIDMVDVPSQNNVLLAEELNIPLYCDDRILRAVLRGTYEIRSFSTLSLFNFVFKNNFISLDEKHAFHQELLDLNYEFISIDANFIYSRLKMAGYNVESIKIILTAVSKKDTSVESLGVVLSDLLLLIMTDTSLLSKQKVEIFKKILLNIEVNHDLTKIEEIMFGNLESRVANEKRVVLKGILRLIFAK